MGDAERLPTQPARPGGEGSVVVQGSGIDPTGRSDSTEGVRARVAEALGCGADLVWPVGSYLTTASIPGLHDVRHRGRGVLLRGTTAFHPEPVGEEPNALHLSSTGDDRNDGLSPGEPKLTFQAAFDALTTYGPVLDGRWEIVAEAGRYPCQEGTQTLTTPSRHRVLVRGPEVWPPDLPAAVLDGAGGGPYDHGLSGSGIGVRFELRDLMFVGFDAGPGDSTRIGALGEKESDARFVNVHVSGASWCGIYAFNTVRARVTGGVLSRCRSGLVANTTQCTVWGTAVESCTESGIYWSRGSQGHLDHCSFSDNAVGVVVAENSRVATVGCLFARNVTAVRTRTGGYFSEAAAANVYHSGTPDAQVRANVESATGSGDAAEAANGQSYVRVGYDRTTRTLTGTTDTTVLSTPYTLPAHRLAGPGKQMRVHVLGVFTATSAGSVMCVGIGGLALLLTVPRAAANVTFEIDVTLLEVSGGYRAIGSLSQGLSAFRYGTASSGFDAGARQDVVISATPTSVDDALSLYRTDVYVMG